MYDWNGHLCTKNEWILILPDSNTKLSILAWVFK